MPSSYLFYDIETSGLNKCFDQVVQFAAIRTDMNLEELERHEIFVRLNPEVVPSPRAFLTHGISLDQLHSGLCEYEALKKIHHIFNIPGTIAIGYNNLGFDDEFLRFSFYRNLLDPYGHQYAQGCHRMDLYPMVVVYYLFKPSVLSWPKLADVPTLRLEYLNGANELVIGKAHNAMHDVLVTIVLAHKLKEMESMWIYLNGCFNKDRDYNRLVGFPRSDHGWREGLLIDGNMGAARLYQTQAMHLGFHRHYKNQSLWLPLDYFSLASVDETNFRSHTFVQRKRFGENPIPLPLVKRFCHHLTEERWELAQMNRLWIDRNRDFFMEIISHHREYKYPEIPNLDLDAALYQNGFISHGDRLDCDHFHSLDGVAKVVALESFSNDNLRTQALRILGRNYPQLLARNKQLAAAYRTSVRSFFSDTDTMVSYKNEPRLTKTKALEEITMIKTEKKLNTGEMDLLSELTKYIQSL